MSTSPSDLRFSLLEGVRVVDAAGEPAAMAGRILADLGATVVKVGDPKEDPWRRLAWDRGCERVPEATTQLLAAADVVIETPGWPGAPVLDPAAAPGAVWVCVTPFGLTGPRAGWVATDLGVMAASGNIWATGDPDRPPVRPSQPAAYAHVGPEVALAALTALASGRPQRVDVSMQEVVLAADMCAPARLVRTGERFVRRGVNVGRTREVWPCKDGWVSFGLRGGKARVPSLETITRLCVEEGVATPGLTDRDWTTWSVNDASEEELRAVEEPVAALFARKTMRELYDVACEANLMLAPVNSPREILASRQLAARGVLDDHGLPRTFFHPRVLDGLPRHETRAIHRQEQGRGAWAGVRILEFGSGAAGPISTRYFVEHGATVVRVESRSRPDFLRTYGVGGQLMFDGLNVGKLSVTLDLKHPDGVAVAKRLVAWADAVVENFAPKAMRGFGLHYDALAGDVPDLVMVSSCLNGQTGPHRDYPGFGGQGAALSGWNFVTGWPDRAPVGPFGTITDSLAPRFVAAALAAGLLRRRRTGQGVHLDVSQVECGVYALSPWLARFASEGLAGERCGNAHPDAPLHDVYPCAGDDRWVAVACWTDEEWELLAGVTGAGEEALAGWTSRRSPEEVAETLQALGIEAVPVQDFDDLLADAQLAHRGHFVGEGPYERNGFRLSDASSGYDRPGPGLGEHTRQVLTGLLGMTGDEVDALEASGALD